MVKRGERTTAPGQRRSARAMGIAEWQPKARASYEAAATTPRPVGEPPMSNGWPANSGRSSASTEA